MTRGRQSNTAYVALDRPDPLHSTPPDPNMTACGVLFGVLNHTGAEVSAHQTTEAEQNRWAGIAQLAAEYESIATVAQRERWTRLVRGALCSAGGLAPDDADRAVQSEAFSVLAARLRRAEAYGYDVDALLSRLVARRSLLDADDVAAVLAARLGRATTRPLRGVQPDLVGGRTAAARGPMPEEAVRALDERRALIENHLRESRRHAVLSRRPLPGAAHTGRGAGRPQPGVTMR